MLIIIIVIQMPAQASGKMLLYVNVIDITGIYIFYFYIVIHGVYTIH